MKSNKILVVGNGESRQHIDIDLYREDHTIIGCNAIHRDTVVDHLICCDQRMVNEAVNNPNILDTEIYTRSDWFNYFHSNYKNINLVPELPYVGDQKQDQPINWGSGVYALLLAAILNPELITVIGFDLYSNTDTVNNCYKDTANYSNAISKPVDYSYWVYQISKVIEYNPQIDFQFINESMWKLPEEWKKINVRALTINTFTSILVQ